MSDNGYGACTADLVARARLGDQDGWKELIVRYQPLVNAVTRRHRLSAEDGADVSQIVWLSLVRALADLREPQALPGWLATTTTRACLNVLRGLRRTLVMDTSQAEEYGLAGLWNQAAERVEPDEALIRAEACRAIQQGLEELTPAHRELLLLLVSPAMSYEQISHRLGIPIGSIGPTRARCLKKLERTIAVRELFGTARVPARSPLPAAV